MQVFGRTLRYALIVRRRRAAVLPLVAVSTTVMVGFVALTVDVGRLYDARAELQRTADAAAMAAALELAAPGLGDPKTRAKDVATDFAARNQVLDSPLKLDPSDIIFGQARLDAATGRYTFTPSNVLPNAVRVTARRTQGSPSGPVPIFFGQIFGVRSRDVSARATAVLVPRDIVFTLDLSRSHSYDSSLGHYRLTKITDRDVWVDLWDLAKGTRPVLNGSIQGPVFGNMSEWGDNTVDPGWDYAHDSGLVKLQRGQAWNLTPTWASQALNAKGYGTYTSDEMTVINSSTGAGAETSTSDSTQKANYRRRVRVALGIDRWLSGKPDGQAGGNGDDVIDANEVVNLIPYPSSTSNPATNSLKIGGNWDGFIDYVSDIGKADNITSNTGLEYEFLKYDPANSQYGNPDLRWRYGLKTLVQYPQERYPAHSDSPGLAGGGEQPMGAVMAGVQESLDILHSICGNDLVGTSAYGTTGYGPGDKPGNLSWLTPDFDTVRAQVGGLQAGMWTSSTNIAQGIDKGADVLLNSPDSRDFAAKIMILLTDGNANQTRSNPPSNDAAKAKTDALQAATDARARGVQIYCIAVGADADQDLMQKIAKVGEGEFFKADGDVNAYRQQLQNIFGDLSRKRTVALMD